MSKVGVKILKEYLPLVVLRIILIYSHKMLQAKYHKKMQKILDGRCSLNFMFLCFILFIKKY